MEGGIVRCWGHAQYGQLGYGNTLDIGDAQGEMPPKDVAVGNGGVVQIAAGYRHTCLLTGTGKVRCWGRNEYGQLGYGNQLAKGDNLGEMPPPDVNIGGTAVQIAVGSSHSCALLDTGFVRCWGANEQGQLGYGHTNQLGDEAGEMPTPDVVAGGTNIVKLVAGNSNTCVLFDDGTLRCWGGNTSGQLGTGNTEHYGDQPGEMPPPAIVVGGNIVELRAGARMCALLDTNTVRCWGYNADGQLGYGHTNNLGDQPGEMPPADLDLGGPVDFLAASNANQHLCAVLANQSVRCWGNGLYGKLGYGSQNNVGDAEGEMPPAPVSLY